jgi:Family of unknown function (DUF6261)
MVRIDGLSSLQVKDLVDDLANAQQAFEAAYQRKIVDQANPKNAVTVREERPSTAWVITNLISYIDASVKRCPPFVPMVSELNEAITDVMANARSRRTRAKQALRPPSLKLHTTQGRETGPQ